MGDDLTCCACVRELILGSISGIVSSSEAPAVLYPGAVGQYSSVVEPYIKVKQFFPHIFYKQRINALNSSLVIVYLNDIPLL